jgi:1-acyl-sn-glycerol-3-phosphate acyltransferase
MVVKNTLKYMGPFGLAIWMGGAVFVNRANSEAGRKAINEAGEKAKASGKSLFLFPEGTRNHAGGMMAFKKGAFHVALDAKMPILPIVVSEYDFLGPSRHDQFPGGNVTIKVLEPIETDGYDKTSIDELIKKTRDAMVEALKSMND